MKFSLQNMLWVFSLLATAMATFGMLGILVTLLVASFWAAAFRMLRITLLEWLISVTILLVLVALLLPAIGIARGASRRNHCLNNIKQIALAIHNYVDKHGTLPPAYTVDEKGKPLHSWRVLILPFLEHQKLYRAIDLDEPWDGPNNRKLWNRMPEVYRCVSRERACELGAFSDSPSAPSYFAVVGKQTCWPGNNTIKFSDITDGNSQTIWFLESRIPNTCWMEPVDLTVEEAIEVLCTNKRPGHLSINENFFSTSIASYICLAAFADGHGGAIYSGIDKKVAIGLLTRSGNETLDVGEIQDQVDFEPFEFMEFYNWKRIYSFTLFMLLSLLPLRRCIASRLWSSKADKNSRDATASPECTD